MKAGWEKMLNAYENAIISCTFQGRCVKSMLFDEISMTMLNRLNADITDQGC